MPVVFSAVDDALARAAYNSTGLATPLETLSHDKGALSVRHTTTPHPYTAAAYEHTRGLETGALVAELAQTAAATSELTTRISTHLAMSTTFAHFFASISPKFPLSMTLMAGIRNLNAANLRTAQLTAHQTQTTQ